MNFNSNNSDNKSFDFSILYYNHYDNIDTWDDTSIKPENIEDEIFYLLSDAVKNKGEIRFVGLTDNGDYMIHRCYKKNEHIWDNLYYDDLADLLNNVKNNNNIHRIHNCLMY